MLLCSFLLDPRVRVALLSVFFFPGLAPAQTEYKLLPSNASDNAQAGWSVALSGDVAIVGAPGDSEAVFGGGSAYVYRFDGTAWTQEQKLTTDAEILERFGYSVAVSGNIAVVGMPYDSDGGAASGSVFVYRFDGTSWVEEQKLTASDGGAGDLLGWSVATTGDFVVATAGVNDDSDSEDGAAYVFRYDGAGWVEEQKLEPGELDSDDGDFFGWSVAASGDAVIVGAPGEKVDGFGSGSAYVYRYGGGAWAEEQRIDAGYIGAQFGWAVSISGDVAVVGARFDIDPTDPSAFLGSAYVFRRDGGVWVEEDQFTVPAGEGNVGLSVAVSSDLAVTAGGRDNVFAYRYENGAWSSAQELTASD
ncbi:MAG: FG-GAP repeat protein, partial [Rhodothermales bacterium]|nr:FG-GAP repeat protein [Rhodothermales bacterium]